MPSFGPPEVLLRSVAKKVLSLKQPVFYPAAGVRRFHKVALCTELGKPLTVEERPIPSDIGNGEVRVAVHAVGLNFADLLTCKGTYQVKRPVPFVPGMELAGTVDEVGEDVEHLQKGDRVLGFSYKGALAEYTISMAKSLMKIPDSISYVQASALLTTYGTSLLALSRKAQLKSGETVLVTAAAGGTGLGAVDLAANVFGATVIGACGSPEKFEIVKQKGAKYVIDYNKEDVRARLKEITAGRGVDVVFDTVGGDGFINALKSLAWEGRILTIGYTSGTIPNIPANLLLLKSGAAMSAYWGEYANKDPAVFVQSILDVIEYCRQGKINPHIGFTFPLSQVNDAFSCIESRKSTGKVVVKIRE